MRWSKARLSRVALLSILASAAIACGAAPPPPAPVAKPAPKPAAPPAPPPPSASWLPATEIARIEDEKTSPYFARRGDEGLLLYTSGGRWLTRLVGADGKPKTTDPLDIAPAPSTSMAVLKPTADGYLVVWSELVAQNRAVKLLSLDEGGKKRGEPLLVAQITDELAWVDVLPNAEGSLVLWDIPREDKADVFMTPVLGGKVAGAPALVAQGVIGWEALATAKGAAIAMVAVPPPPDPKAAPKGKKKEKAEPVAEAPEAESAKLGTVLLAEVDAHGKLGTPVTVSSSPTAQVDVEIAEVGGKYVLAWTDERDIDGCVYVASVDPGGKIASPAHRATAPVGEQALVALVAAPYGKGAGESKRALVGWEDLLKAPRAGRLIHLATLGPDGSLGKERATLTFGASGPPDLVPDGDGFAALTIAPMSDDDAKDQSVWPWYVRLGPDLSVIASEPVRAAPFGEDGKPDATWALSCNGGSCLTLASGGQQGSPLATVTLPIREGSWKAPARRDADDSLPHPTSVTALYDGDHLSRVSAVDLPAGGSLAAWVTYYLEGSSGGGRRKGGAKKPAKNDEGPFATLGVRPIGADGAKGKTSILSQKALSIGGVALAAPKSDGAKKPEVAVAWVAKEKGEPQVFVTTVGADGAKIAQKGVTVISRKQPKKGAIPSEASDVAIADAGDGYIVAWVDTRDGNAEIYAAKLDRQLNKVIPDRRITEAPGDSAEVQIAVRDKDVILVWSDARKNPDEGTGDIYLAHLEAGTLKKVAPEKQLFASALHSRTPQIVASGSGFLVSWIEDAFGAGDRSGGAGPGKAEAVAERGLRVAQIDAKGTMIGVPQLVRGEGQAPVTSAALACAGNKGCRGVLTSAVGETLVLGAFALSPGAPAGPLKSLATLTGATTQDVSPVFTSGGAGSLFFADDAVGGSGRVRWMQIAWP